MPEIRGVGPVYWHLQKWPWAPKLVARTWAREIEEKCRIGSGVGIRVSRRWTLAVGIWNGAAANEEEALSAAGVRYLEATITDIKDWDNGLPEEGADEGRGDCAGEEDCVIAGWRISGLDRAEPVPDRPGAL